MTTLARIGWMMVGVAAVYAGRACVVAFLGRPRTLVRLTGAR